MTVIFHKKQEGRRKRGREGDGKGGVLMSYLITWLDAYAVEQRISCHAAGPWVREAEDPFWTTRVFI